MKASATAPSDITVPYGVPQTFDEHIKLQFSLMEALYARGFTSIAAVSSCRWPNSRKR